MTLEPQDLFPQDISDEAAYHLIDFFYNLALAFESQNLAKAMRYQKSLISQPPNPDKPWETTSREELPDPPF